MSTNAVPVTVLPYMGAHARRKSAPRKVEVAEGQQTYVESALASFFAGTARPTGHNPTPAPIRSPKSIYTFAAPSNGQKAE